jgi:hypothetical protein
MDELGGSGYTRMANFWRRAMIWAYGDTVKVSYHLHNLKWYLLHNVPIWTET